MRVVVVVVDRTVLFLSSAAASWRHALAVVRLFGVAFGVLVVGALPHALRQNDWQVRELDVQCV